MKTKGILSTIAVFVMAAAFIYAIKVNINLQDELDWLKIKSGYQLQLLKEIYSHDQDYWWAEVSQHKDFLPFNEVMTPAEREEFYGATYKNNTKKQYTELKEMKSLSSLSR